MGVRIGGIRRIGRMGSWVNGERGGTDCRGDGLKSSRFNASMVSWKYFCKSAPIFPSFDGIYIGGF